MGPNEDCKIPPKPPVVREPREGDCTWLVGAGADERRCRARAKWDTALGEVCTRHQNYLLAHGHLDSPGAALGVA